MIDFAWHTFTGVAAFCINRPPQLQQVRSGSLSDKCKRENVCCDGKEKESRRAWRNRDGAMGDLSSIIVMAEADFVH